MPSPIKSPRIALIAALMGASALTACAVVGPNYTRPNTPNVAGYAMQGRRRFAAHCRHRDRAAAGRLVEGVQLARTRRDRASRAGK